MVIRDQIHGDMEFSDAEMLLIRSKSFERMRYIKQLGFVEMSYPGASHNRYQHSLGACACVTDMYNAVVTNCPEFYRDGDVELLRMCMLVHDMGHPPFSHASEELSNMSHEARLRGILELEKKNIVLAHEYDCESWDLVYQVYSADGLIYLSDPHLISLHSFLDSFIDADKLDYLERDSYNCGVNYGKFDRAGLIRNLTMIRDSNGKYSLAVKSSGIQALESFILARYYMFSHIYMSPDERMLRYRFVEEMKQLLPDGKYPDDPKKFLLLDDTKYVRKLKCMQTKSPFVLIYDGEFNPDVKAVIDRRLGRDLFCDTPRKNIFRKDTDDSTVMIVDDVGGKVIPCAEASPILKNIEYTNIHRLRYYALADKASGLKRELTKLVDKVVIST